MTERAQALLGCIILTIGILGPALIIALLPVYAGR